MNEISYSTVLRICCNSSQHMSAWTGHTASHMWPGLPLLDSSVWPAVASVSLICINLHERCLIILLPCMDVSGARGLDLSHCLYVFWVCFLSIFIRTCLSYLLPTPEKRVNIEVKSVRKAHRGAGI